jgi:nitroimidazol reductase NimA-like FMN-containing flavoprotein (pyridoxamine 5'-phosphate oxidase superfamily)
MTTGTIDLRFGDPAAKAPPWPAVVSMLTAAELYWLTTVRADGRPHVAPLVGVWHDGGFAFCTGRTEQKTVNLRANPHVAATTGVNRWKSGTDIVVEGRAEQVTGRTALEPLARAWRDKYGDDWPWQATDEGFVDPDGSRPIVFRVPPDKVIVFGKAPHSQTTYRF